MSQPIHQVEHLKKYFPAGGRKVLRAVDDVSFSVQEGEILGIVGESGCGKTTCGRTAIGLYSKTDGVSLYRGEDIHRMRGAKRRAFCCQVQTVFQDPYASLDPKNKVIDLIAEGMDIHHLYASQAERREKVQALMEQVGLNPSGIDRYPYEFSGGMRQRVLTAIAVAARPQWLIADEPTKGLDAVVRNQVYDTFCMVRDQYRVGFIVITHDLLLARKFCERIVVMYCGRVLETNAARELFEHPRHPYTQGLIASLPHLGMKPMAGFSPAFTDQPSGCVFHPRCPYAEARCRHTEPKSIPCGEGSVCCHRYA